MNKYKEYLAANVLNEGKVIDFRLLSRALKVHVDQAKRMLFEFHRLQNAKKPNSVHATYVIYGAKTAQSKPELRSNSAHEQDGGDTVMQSSPLVSSMPEQEQEEEAKLEDIPITTIALVQEEDFEKTKAEFQLITAVHVHSIQPTRLANVNVLSDCTRELVEKYGSEDPLKAWQQYGVIQNPAAKRRSNKRPAGVVATPAASLKAAPKQPAASKSAAEKLRPSEVSVSAGVNAQGAVRVQAGTHAAPVANLSTSKAPPKLERERSDLFKAFNKAKNLPKKEPTRSQDTSMGDADEGEDAGDLVPLSNAGADEAHRKARAERAEKLKQMMEDEDEDMVDIPPAEDEPIEEEEQAAPIDATPEPETDQKETNVEVVGGRRRGRRRVMKKKVTKDAEGYLVTKEEPAWESFSEDEPAPAPKRTKLPTVNAPATKGKAPTKKGQGNLMNFFGKK